MDASLLHQCFSFSLPLSLKAMKKMTMGDDKRNLKKPNCLYHRWQTQGLRAESGPPPCFIQPGTLFLSDGSAELLLNC